MAVSRRFVSDALFRKCSPACAERRRNSMPEFKTASRGNTKAVCGKRAITPIEDVAKSRRDGEKISRSCPPDSPHGVAINIRSKNVCAISQEQTQVTRQFGLAQPKFFANPVGLERCDVESAPPQRALPKWNPSPAKPAGIVVKNPAHRLPIDNRLFHHVTRTAWQTVTAEPSARNAGGGLRFIWLS